MNNWSTFWKKSSIIIFFGVLFIFFFPIFYVDFLCQYFPKLNFEPYGTIGDTLGGMTGPFINLAGAILVYAAFKAQREANQKSEEHHFFDYMVNQINRFEDIYINKTINLEEVHRSISSSNRNCSVIKEPIMKDGKEIKFDSKNTIQAKFNVSDLQKVKLLLTSVMLLLEDIRRFDYSSKKEKSVLIKFLTIYQIFLTDNLEDIINILKDWDTVGHYTEQQDLIQTILETEKGISKSIKLLKVKLNKNKR